MTRLRPLLCADEGRQTCKWRECRGEYRLSLVPFRFVLHDRNCFVFPVLTVGNKSFGFTCVSEIGPSAGRWLPHSSPSRWPSKGR